MGKIIVTGGSGFIGSVIVGYLNKKGHNNIVIVDDLDFTEKWKNLVGKDYLDYLDKIDFINKIENNFLEENDIVIHMGACSSTTEKNSKHLMENNSKYTYKLYEATKKVGAKLLYASSAATYGDGNKGYDDNNFDLEPLNMYGYSKYLADKRIIRDTNNFEKNKNQVVGLKFFNVYGPNEYFKGNMASMIFHGFSQIKKDKNINLFKSYKEGYQNGGQKRDFIYVLDIAKIIYFFIKKNISGIYNVGTGTARTFNDLSRAVFKALDIKEETNYIDMPEGLEKKYQYYTKANIEKIRKAGYEEEFYSLEEGVHDYINNYLIYDKKTY